MSRQAFLAVTIVCGLAASTLLADQRGRAGANLPAARQSVQTPRQGDLKPGDIAPDFTLEPRGGGTAVTLSSFRGRQPIALVFGSFT